MAQLAADRECKAQSVRQGKEQMYQMSSNDKWLDSFLTLLVHGLAAGHKWYVQLSRIQVDLSQFFPRRVNSTFLQVADLSGSDYSKGNHTSKLRVRVYLRVWSG